MKNPRNQNGKRRSPHAKTRGVFISFEGIEGCGKTTQAQRLARLLQGEGMKILETREPGGTPFAEEIRNLLLKDILPKHRNEWVTPPCEAALIFASRAHHVTYRIRPALSQGLVVLCDRFSDSTLAYQGYGRGLDLKDLIHFNDFSTDQLSPDHTFLFDLPVKQGLARRRRASKQNRLDKESVSFHERVRRGFLDLARKHPTRITVLDGRKSPEAIATEVAATTHSIINLKMKPRVKTNLAQQGTP